MNKKNCNKKYCLLKTAKENVKQINDNSPKVTF